MDNTTRTIAGHALTLRAGVQYFASRPFASRGRTIYPVTIQPLGRWTDDVPAVTVQALSFDQADALVNGFNNGAVSWDGRVWS